jgi:hypothetical protein
MSIAARIGVREGVEIDRAALERVRKRREAAGG